MKLLIEILLLLALEGGLSAQELFVKTEPASNMAKGTIGLRLNSEFIPSYKKLGWRLAPEIMLGINRNLMVHASFYGSSIYQTSFEPEGASLYAKYRILALDDIRSHFRIATFTRFSLIHNPVPYAEINLQGDNSGFQTGIVLTQLIHKLALSATTNYDHATHNLNEHINLLENKNQIAYSISAGYLLFPKTYRDYKQINLNLYLEFLGKSSLDGFGSFIDMAPSIQFIFGSRTRLDFSYERQIAGDLSRISNIQFLTRLEYTLFNVL